MQAKIQEVREVIKEAFSRFERLIVCWTGGKDSTVLLWNIKEVCEQQAREMPQVVFIDDGDVFSEIWEFVHRITEEWRLDLQVIKNSDLLGRVRKIGDTVEVRNLSEANQKELAAIDFREDIFVYEPESYAGNHLLKTVPLNDYIRSKGIEGVFTAIRRDEHPARSEEKFFSPRQEPPHVRVHPVLNLTERDIWDVIFGEQLPYCVLYEQGYRSIGARYNTRPTASEPAWLQDFSLIPERAGRGQNKEKIMSQLRSLGYM